MIAVRGGPDGAGAPAALTRGTVVELRDLFFATPARLKFLRSDRAEAQAMADVMRRLAMAEPLVGFTLRDVTGGEARELFRADPERGRPVRRAARRGWRAVLGATSPTTPCRIDAERDGLRLPGYAALPTYSRGAAVAAVPVRQRPPRAGQAAARRAAGRLFRRARA